MQSPSVVHEQEHRQVDESGEEARAAAARYPKGAGTKLVGDAEGGADGDRGGRRFEGEEIR